MKILIALSLTYPFTLGLAADDAAKTLVPDDSMAHVLKVDQIHALAEELGDSSESGQNQAAVLMANSKRIETEARIGSKSMRRVMVLADWRKALNQWSDIQLELVWCWSGGGSMYYHMMQRNDVVSENFLAGLAERLPLTGKPLTKQTEAKIDDLLEKSKARLVQAKAENTRTGDIPLSAIENLARRMEEAHAALKSQFQNAGDEPTTQLLLDFCVEPAELWE